MSMTLPPRTKTPRLRLEAPPPRLGTMVLAAGLFLLGPPGCAPSNGTGDPGTGDPGSSAGTGGSGTSFGVNGSGGSGGSGEGFHEGAGPSSGGSSTGGAASGGSSTSGVSASGGAPAADSSTGGAGSGGAASGGSTAASPGRGGSSPLGGRGGPAGGSTGSVAIGGPSQCTAGKYAICEDFEATAVGAVPTGWTKHGNAAVASDQAARGMHSLKISAAASGERRIYADASKLGSGHWGRIFYRVELPVPTVFVHSTLVGLQGVGPSGGNGEYRVVDTVKDATGKHQFLYNVQPGGAEFGKGSAYNWMFDGQWHCAEWHIDNPTQSFQFFYDGVEVTQIALSNGMGSYKGTDIPPVFSQVHVGWNNYQSAAPGFVAWVDEVAMDPSRIGCQN